MLGNDTEMQDCVRVERDIAHRSVKEVQNIDPTESIVQQPTPALRDGGSRVELELDYELPGGWLGELLERTVVDAQNEREAEQSLERLKTLAEKAGAE